MGNIVQFKKPALADKAKAHTMCKRNFHKWKIVTEQKFDVKQGKLVTLFRCSRCGKEKTKAV